MNETDERVHRLWRAQVRDRHELEEQIRAAGNRSALRDLQLAGLMALAVFVVWLVLS